MKKLLSQASMLGALTLVLASASAAPAAADGWHHHHRHRIRYQYTANDDLIPYYGVCRVGWWQTLRYGHVRPRWGAWCR